VVAATAVVGDTVEEETAIQEGAATTNKRGEGAPTGDIVVMIRNPREGG